MKVRKPLNVSKLEMIETDLMRAGLNGLLVPQLVEKTTSRHWLYECVKGGVSSQLGMGFLVKVLVRIFKNKHATKNCAPNHPILRCGHTGHLAIRLVLERGWAKCHAVDSVLKEEIQLLNAKI